MKTGNNTLLYVVKSFRENGRVTSRIVEKLGTLEELGARVADPIAWAKQRVDELTAREKEAGKTILVEYSPTKIIDKDVSNSCNGGYLFLQKIYRDLNIHHICKTISDKYKFEFNLDAVMSRLVYSRLIFPASKLATMELSQKFIERPDFDLHQIYRALEVISKESDLLQSELYKNSLNVCKRKTGILYYDCTNYFFEIEEEEGLKQYGYSKEHRPNPIVQMGLFMDANGIPLAFSITAGNTNEQTTLVPFDFYGTCTNLDEPIPEIIKINHNRWEIEECFRIMKSELKARPVYLSRDDRIKAHFMTCFITLLIYRLLEKKLDGKFTCHQIIDGLRNMNFQKIRGEGYIPAYTRTNFTDALHEKFGFRTDYQIIPVADMRRRCIQHIF